MRQDVLPKKDEKSPHIANNIPRNPNFKERIFLSHYILSAKIEKSC